MTNNFIKLGINERLIKLLEKQCITEPTPVQEQVIPAFLDSDDIIAQAQTGTGKTYAFALPIMELIDLNKPHVQALIITPTRELALQITVEIKKLSEYKAVNILAAYGGQDVERQVRKLKGTVHIVIGTPGRLLDHIRRESIDLSRVSMLILDEADRMLDMGFLQDVEQIIHKTPKERQTLLFSATIPKRLRSLALKYMKEPKQIHIQSKSITLTDIYQEVIETTDRDKKDVLCKVIDEYKPFMAIIFCRTKRRVGTLNDDLQSRGYNCDELHGDLTQGKREKVMKAFRELKTQFLIATDVAARGLDIEGVTHVFNYDIPQDAESYIHRIGRTGRAGQTGVAITFVAQRDRETLHKIELGIKTPLRKRRMTSNKQTSTMRTDRTKKISGREHSRSKPNDNRRSKPGFAKFSKLSNKTSTPNTRKNNSNHRKTSRATSKRK